LANLFLHYAFDMWMMRTYPHIPFERYADDAKTADEAEALRSALADRFAACKLVLRTGTVTSQTNRLTFSGSNSEREKRGQEGIGPLRASFLPPAQRR
jgi:hypothetical protein